jgi:PAS domain S-box-containing protein
MVVTGLEINIWNRRVSHLLSGRQPYAAFGLSLLGPPICTAVYLALSPWLDPVYFILFFPLIILVALSGGVLPGILCTLICGIYANVWIMGRAGIPLWETARVAKLAVFLADGFAISLFTHLATRRASRLQAQVLEKERALRSRSRLVNLLNQAPAAMLVLRGRHLICEVANPRAERSFGEGGLIGRELRQILPQLSDGVFERIHLVRASGQGDIFEEVAVPTRGSDGSLVYRRFTMMADLFYDDAQGERDIVFVAFDVTSQAEAREAVEASEAHLRLITDSLPALVSYIGIDGRYRFANQIYQQVFKLSESQIRGMSVRELMGEENHHRLAGSLERAMSGEKVRFETSLYLFEGAEAVHVNVTYVPDRSLNGSVRGVVALITDISEHKAAERALKASEAQLRLHAEQLQSTNEELEQFAYVASHDLKEPLRIVSNYIQLFAREQQGRLTPQTERYVEFIVAGARRMYALINDLLEYSQVGRSSRSFRRVDCSRLVAEIGESLRGPLDEVQARLVIEPLPEVWGAPDELAQLFHHLISNALQFRKPGDAPVIYVRAVSRDGAWDFSVQDNGIGIDPRYKERIFAIFERLGPLEDAGRTGIGLAICKRIVTHHGGAIWVESTVGDGATFHFTLPGSESTPNAP